MGRRKKTVLVKSANIPSIFQSHKELFAKVCNTKPLQGGNVESGPNTGLDWQGVAIQRRDSQAKRKGYEYPVDVGSKKYKKDNKKFLRKIAVNEAKKARRLAFTSKVDLTAITKPR